MFFFVWVSFMVEMMLDSVVCVVVECVYVVSKFVEYKCNEKFVCVWLVI